MILVALKCVEPLGKVTVKKLPTEQSNDAVLDAILTLVTLPLTEPVISCEPLNVFEPVVA